MPVRAPDDSGDSSFHDRTAGVLARGEESTIAQEAEEQPGNKPMTSAELRKIIWEIGRQNQFNLSNSEAVDAIMHEVKDHVVYVIGDGDTELQQEQRNRAGAY